MKRLLPFALLAMLLPGCYKASFVRDVPPRGPVQEQWKSFWLLGVAGHHELDVRQFCPDGNIRLVRTGGDFWTGVVTLFTLGIYAPRIVYVQCGAPQPPMVTEVLP